MWKIQLFEFAKTHSFRHLDGLGVGRTTTSPRINVLIDVRMKSNCEEKKVTQCDCNDILMYAVRSVCYPLFVCTSVVHGSIDTSIYERLHMKRDRRGKKHHGDDNTMNALFIDSSPRSIIWIFSLAAVVVAISSAIVIIC